MTGRATDERPHGWDIARVRALSRLLYHGRSPAAVRFRTWVLAVDVILIAFFIATPFLRQTAGFLFIDYAVAVLLGADLAARGLAAPNLLKWLLRPIVWVDMVVLATLLFPEQLFGLAFLRALRLWTVVNSEFFWTTVGRRYDNTRWEDVVRAAATLVTFLFVTTGVVYTAFAGSHPGMRGYVDALYFTVATLTTTGFGDVTLPGTWGRLLSIVIMVSGITLFVRLAQALLRPYKVHFPCPSCGLTRHEPDAVHCKACGLLLNIPNEE